MLPATDRLLWEEIDSAGKKRTLSQNIDFSGKKWGGSGKGWQELDLLAENVIFLTKMDLFWQALDSSD